MKILYPSIQIILNITQPLRGEIRPYKRKKICLVFSSFILESKIYYLKQDKWTYPITRQLIIDGRKNKVLNNKINLNIPIILFHGTKDNVVPVTYSKKIYAICKKSDRKLVKIKGGHHSLSRISDLKKICFGLKDIITKI